MTLYRKRLTSSFYAIKSSLQRRLDYLLTQQGSVLSDDDLVDVDNEDDAVIAGLESFFEPVDPQEIQYLEELLHQFENTGEDVYRKLRDRINAFATVVGNLQPILAQVPTLFNFDQTESGSSRD